MRTSTLLLLAALAAGAVAESSVSQSRPVSKVITLLKDMVSQLEKEAADDEETYETMGCWCETNDKEKTKSISDAEARIASLGTMIEELTGKSSRLNEEIASLNAELAKNQEALDGATALRAKQLAEFTAEEKGMLASITSLGGAVTALEKHHSGAAFLGVPDQEALNIIATVRNQLHTHASLLKTVISPLQRQALESFVQNPDGFFDDDGNQQIALAQQSPASYSSQSGEVFGILKQMKETFETNLASSQAEESANQKAYEDLKAAKESQIGAATTAVEMKSQELADTDEKNAQSKEDKEDTEDSLAADTKFLAVVKDKCANMDKEYTERTTTRQLETQAVSKALEFLSSDEAHELFGRTFSMLFVQKSQGGRRDVVAKKLKAIAKKVHDPQLSALAVKLRIDSFGKVKDTLTTMMEKLIKEKEEEIKTKEACVDGFNKNERATDENNRMKHKLIAHIDDLTMKLDELSKAIATLNAEIAELKIQLKRAGEDREKENKDFQITVADQKATQKLLSATLGVLKGFYEKYALAQSGKAGSKQPEFKKYEKNEAGAGVMAMIQGIINDAKSLETDAIYAEEDAQKAYEEFVKESNESIEEKTKDLINKTEVKGKTEAQKAEKEKNRDETLATLETLAAENHDLHVSCDYLLKNFDIRNEARDEEVEALKEAIAMFSGASFSTFLQHIQP